MNVYLDKMNTAKLSVDFTPKEEENDEPAFLDILICNTEETFETMVRKNFRIEEMS